METFKNQPSRVFLEVFLRRLQGRLVGRPQGLHTSLELNTLQYVHTGAPSMVPPAESITVTFDNRLSHAIAMPKTP